MNPVIEAILIVIPILFCVAHLSFWIAGAMFNAESVRVLSFRTYRRLKSEGKICNYNILYGVQYYDDKLEYTREIMPRWTWFPIFMSILIWRAFFGERNIV